MTQIHAVLIAAADKFINKNIIARRGDIVTTKWASWKRARCVRITEVGAHLVCRWDVEAKDWIVGFAMDYVAERIRKDGTSTERNPGGGICLSNFETASGRTWESGGKWNEELGFNHAGLSWPRITRAQQRGQS